jgi:uncharacterized protein (DUF2062 family)
MKNRMWRKLMQWHPHCLLRTLCQSIDSARQQFARDMVELRDPALPARQLAAAFAVGTVLSFIPVPLLDTILVGAVLARFRQLNRASLFLARLIWNDLLVFPLYGPGYRLGSAVVQALIGAEPNLPVLGYSAVPLFSFVTGAVLMSVWATLSAYLVFLLVVKTFRSHHQLARGGIG